MAHLYKSTETTMHPAFDTIPDTRLQGWRLVMVRVTWAIIVLATLTLFGFMLPAYFTELQTVCIPSQCATNQLSPDTVQMLHAHHLSEVDYAVFGLVVTLLVTLVCLIVVVLILWGRSDDWMALFVALVLVMEGTICVSYILERGHSVWQLPAAILHTFTFAAIFLGCSLFPDGRLVPRWSRWLAIIWVGWQVVFIIIAIMDRSLVEAQDLLLLADNLIWACLCAGCLIAQIYRYIRVSGPVQRQQTRWIIYGASLLITTVIILGMPFFVVPSLGPGSLYSLLSWYAILLAFIPFPLTIGIAILRYRLWDIDTLINRTLVYGILTAALALVYFGSIVLLQSLFRTFTGQDSPFALVGSTLVIAALFHPLHKNIQTVIDRRFYRSKYLTEQTLQAFSATLRDEMNLTHLQQELLEVVYETIQPAHVSLWLREPTHLSKGDTKW